jgi:GntR family transcriptional regulator
VHTDEHVFSTFFNYVDSNGERISVTAELLAFDYWPVDVTHAGLLGIKPGQIALRIDNLRWSEGRPAMLDRILVSRERFPGITRDIFATRKGSIYGLYQSIASTTVVLIREEVSAVAAPAFAASALRVELGAPILQVCRKAFSYGDEVVEYRDRFVNPAVCRYKNEVGLKE